MEQMLDAYAAAVRAKDVDAFVALYADDVRNFDLWAEWSYDGKEALRGMVAEWFGSLPADEQDRALRPGPRRKILDAADYLEVAPSVVAVARDLDLGGPDLRLPRTPADPDALTELAERWGLSSPIARLVETLTDLGGR